MNYRDELRVCEKCGKKFVFTVEEQRMQDNMGLEIAVPDRCPKCRENIEPEPGLRPGVVKWFSEEKGFGFLVQSDGSEVFFHRTGIIGESTQVAKDDAPIWYQLRQTERGLEAYDVHVRE